MARAALVFAGSLLLASPARAIDPFELEVQVGTEQLSLGFTSMEDVIDQLDPERLQSRFGGTTADPRRDSVFVDINFRGLPGVVLEFPDTANPLTGDQATRLLFQIPVLGISEEILGEATRGDALEELFDRLKTKKGLLKRLLTGLTRYSPIDPLAGNPDSLFSRRMRSDMEHGFTHKVSQVWGCGTSAFDMTNDRPILLAAAGPVSDIFADAQERAAELQAGNEMGLGVIYTTTTAETDAGDYKSTGIVIPLSYTAKLDFNPQHKVRFDFPLSHTDTGGAESYGLGFGLAYTFPVSDAWTLTPAAGAGATGSVDLISAGGVSAYSVTSAYTWRLGDYALSMGNAVGKYDSLDLKIGDVEAGADVSNTVFTNGFMLTGPNSMIASNLVVEYSFTNTQITGDEVFTDQYNEVGVALGRVGTDMGIIDNYLKLGLSYLMGSGQGDINQLKANLSFRF